VERSQHQKGGGGTRYIEREHVHGDTQASLVGKMVHLRLEKAFNSLLEKEKEGSDKGCHTKEEGEKKGKRSVGFAQKKMKGIGISRIRYVIWVFAKSKAWKIFVASGDKVEGTRGGEMERGHSRHQDADKPPRGRRNSSRLTREEKKKTDGGERRKGTTV